MLYCDNQLCIHQNNHQCSLKEISIDAIGRYINCLYLNIPSQELKKMKKRLYAEQTAVYRIEPHPQLAAPVIYPTVFQYPPNPIRGKIKRGRIKKGCSLPFTKKEHPIRYYNKD